MAEGLNAFQMARQAVQLESLMAWERRTNKRFPSGLRMEGCFDPKCESGDRFRTSIRNGYFRCWSCGAAGDVVKAASLAWNMSQSAAARELLQKKACFAARKVVASSAAGDVADVAGQWAITELTEKLFETRFMDDAVRASLNRRCITNAVIDEALEHGLLLGLPTDPLAAKAAVEDLVGSRLPRHAGMWRDAQTVPACVFRPLWFRHGQGCIETRAIAEGVKAAGSSLLRYGSATTPYTMPAIVRSHEPKVFCKSPLDALSLRVMGRLGEIAALPGDSSWVRADAGNMLNQAWFTGLRSAHVMFSGHQAGRKRAVALVAHLRNAGVAAEVLTMPEGLDVNDMLCSTAMI